jgi:hypothetical protein
VFPSLVAHVALLTGRTEWASGDVSQVVQWDSSQAGDIVYHKFSRQTQEQFRENSEIASWGDWYLTTRSDSGVSQVFALVASKTLCPS